MKTSSKLLTLDMLKRLVINKILQRKTAFTALSDMHGRGLLEFVCCVLVF